MKKENYSEEKLEKIIKASEEIFEEESIPYINIDALVEKGTEIRNRRELIISTIRFAALISFFFIITGYIFNFKVNYLIYLQVASGVICPFLLIPIAKKVLKEGYDA